MPHIDASEGTCTVYTYKEGVLSSVAHDLAISVTKWKLQWEKTNDGELQVDVELDAHSLKVMGAVHNGRVDPMGERDVRKIEDSIRDDVLHSKRHPTIRYQGQLSPLDKGYTAKGKLALHGKERGLDAVVSMDAEGLVAKVVVDQPDFGIAPFSAMFGTLRVQPRVTVEFRIPNRAIPARLH